MLEIGVDAREHHLCCLPHAGQYLVVAAPFVTTNFRYHIMVMLPPGTISPRRRTKSTLSPVRVDDGKARSARLDVSCLLKSFLSASSDT